MMGRIPLVSRAAHAATMVGGLPPAPVALDKAAGDVPSLERFLSAANKLATPIRSQVLDFLSAMAEDAPEALWESTLESGDPTPLFEWVWERLTDPLDTLQRGMQRIVTQAAQHAGVWQIPGGQIRFDLPNPIALAWLADYPVPLVTRLRQTVRDTIAQTVAQAIGDGVNPRQAARRVRMTRGFALLPQHAAAVRAYRRELEQLMAGGGPPARRVLVDHRFTHRALTPEKIDTMVTRYAERLLQYRATMITRTESIRALNAGNWLAMHYAAEQGLVQRALLVRRWIPAPDNATGGGPCPVCLEIARRNEGGVGFDEPFVVNDTGETIMHPPYHPHCRCVVWTRPRLSTRERFVLSDAYLPPPLRGRSIPSGVLGA